MAERLARDVQKLFTAVEALTIETPDADSAPTQELTERETEAVAPQEEDEAIAPEEETRESPEQAEFIPEGAPSSPMLADSEIAAEGELPPSPAPPAEEQTEELPPRPSTPVEGAAAASPANDEDQASKSSCSEPMDVNTEKEDVEQPEPEDELRKKALQTLPRWARGEAAERDGTSLSLLEVAEPLRYPVPPVLVLPPMTASKVTLVAEAITFRMPQEGEQKEAWYRPDLFQRSKEQGAFPKIVRRPRTIYRTDVPEIQATPVEEPMEVDMPASTAAAPSEVPRDITESDWEEERPVQTRAEKETNRATTGKAATSSSMRSVVEVPPPRRVATPIPALPIDTAPIA